MKLMQLPGLTFASADVETLDASITSTVENLLGRKLARGDPLRLFLRGIEAVIMQQRLLIDECAKQNLLAYATGENLDHLGALVGLERLPATAATVTMRLKLSSARAQATNISATTRFTAGDTTYFQLTEAVTFLAGETVKDAHAQCLSVGVVGNDYDVGEINTIVDPQAFLESASNVTKSEGGADVEADDAYRERIHEAPEMFSVAGPTGAYRSFAMSVSPSISDVAVWSPEPGHVEVRPLLSGGVVPEDELIERVHEVLNDRRIRPLTDVVTVKAPAVRTYEIDCDYWINRSDQTVNLTIQAQALKAVEGYIAWQRERLGRDINPSELIYRLKEAGVKRVVVRQPTYEEIGATDVAIVGQVRARYCGEEED